MIRDGLHKCGLVQITAWTQMAGNVQHSEEAMELPVQSPFLLFCGNGSDHGRKLAGLKLADLDACTGQDLRFTL